METILSLVLLFLLLRRSDCIFTQFGKLHLLMNGYTMAVLMRAAANHCHSPSPPLPDLGRISPRWLLERLDQGLLGSVLTVARLLLQLAGLGGHIYNVAGSGHPGRSESGSQAQSAGSSSPPRRGPGAGRSPRRVQSGGCSLAT